jgi:hypothetical protein
MVDQNDHVVLGGYPAELRRLLGLCGEELVGRIEIAAHDVFILLEERIKNT